MTAIKTWLIQNGLSLLLGGAGLGAVLLLAKKVLPGYLAGLMGKQLTKLESKFPEDKDLILALVKWAEKKIPERGQGKERMALVAAKLVQMFPVLKKQESLIAEVVEEAVWRMDEELKKQGQQEPPAPQA